MEFAISLPKNGPIATKQKANILIELLGSNVTIGFDLCHDLDLEYSRSNIEFPISQPKMVRLPRNEKQTYRLNSRAQMWSSTIILTFEFWRSNVTLTFDHTRPWPWIFVVKFWYSCISEWEGWLTLHKGGGSRSFMTMTMTIWWPRSGVWIYQIVTGVTLVVGVPWTHLVVNWNLGNKLQWNFNQNSKSVFEENAFENIICKMSAILSLRQFVKFIMFTDLISLLCKLWGVCCIFFKKWHFNRAQQYLCL